MSIIFEDIPVKSICADCPFRKDTRQQSLACEALVESIEMWESGLRERHSCHKTDPRAFGYTGKHEGNTRVCAGSIASAKKSDINFGLFVNPKHLDLVYSFNEIKTVYKSALRRIRRWNRKKERVMSHYGLLFDAHDAFISDGAIHAHVNYKERFWGFIRVMKGIRGDNS